MTEWTAGEPLTSGRDLPARTRSVGERRLLLFVSAPLVAVVGAALLASGRIYLAAFGLLLLGISLLLVLMLRLERQWEAAWPGPALGVDGSGRPATVVARATFTWPMRWAVVAVLTAPLLVAGAGALRDGRPLLALGLGAGAVVLALGLAPRSSDSGGVVLTPEGVCAAHHGQQRSVVWSDVTRVAVGLQLSLELRQGKPLRIAGRHLAVHPFRLALLLDMCRTDDRWRRELGTTQSLQWPVWRYGR